MTRRKLPAELHLIVLDCRAAEAYLNYLSSIHDNTANDMVELWRRRRFIVIVNHIARGRTMIT